VQSHGGWYDYSCTRLSAAGFAVYFLDRRGSGLNQQERGDTRSYRRLVDDIAEFIRQLRSNASGAVIPLFLAGISWGGKLAVAFQRRHPGEVDGIALLCPGFFPKVKPSLLERLGIACFRLVKPSRLFPIPLNEPELFTTAARWQAFIREDPLSLRRATARFLVESFRLDRYLLAVPPFIDVPVLLMLAGRDRIINNEATRRFVAQFAASDKRIIEYPDASHTLEFEAEPDFFIHDLDRWLSDQSQAALEHRLRATSSGR
jgi:alpha-beta hydrolase superfamily lysophospholipase